MDRPAMSSSSSGKKVDNTAPEDTSSGRRSGRQKEGPKGGVVVVDVKGEGRH